MRTKTLISALAVLFMSEAGLPPGKCPLPMNSMHSGTGVIPDFGRVPLYFIPNQGQVDEQVRFYAKASSYTLWMIDQGLVFDSIRNRDEDGPNRPRIERATADRMSASASWARETSRLVFIGAAPRLRAAAGQSSSHRVHYFLGNDPAQWRTDIPTSLEVRYAGVYPNVDLRVYGNEREIEYDWIVKPGGRPEAIRFAYRDMRTTRIDGDGNISVETGFGTILHRKPESFQEIGGLRIPVESRFADYGAHTYGIQVGAYDDRFPLIIDPVVLVYSTYLGGAAKDKAYAIAVDTAGSAYVAGSTESSNFPLKNPADGSRGNMDAFLTKFTPSGSALVYSTFYGGIAAEEAFGVALGPDKSAYIVGRTNSQNLPVKSAFDPTPNGTWDAFIARFSPSGSALRYSTYLGGSGSEYGYAVAVDGAGAAYAAGGTFSSNFPVLNALDDSYGGGVWEGDGFVTKISPSGTALLYSTYLGGSGDDVVHDIAVDKSKAAYLTGGTTSSDFPIANAFDSTKGKEQDIFVAKLTPAGNSLAFSTYLGGGGYSEIGNAIAVDATGAAYVAGITESKDFPVKNAFDSTPNGLSLFDADAFVTKFAPAGDSLVFSTYLGGERTDDARGIAVLGNGTIFVAGYTFSKNYPLLNPYDDELDVTPDVFITKFAAEGNRLLYSTFLGGSDGGEWANDLALHGSGTPYVVGETNSTNFPRKNAFDKSYNGQYDAFVTRLKYQK